MIELLLQSTHLKVIYKKSTAGEIAKSEKILTTKFQAKDLSMARTELVKKGIISDIKNFYNTEYNILPIGFLPFLEKYYNKENINYILLEMRKFPSVNKDILKEYLSGKIMFGDEIPRDYQRESVLEVIKNKGGQIEISTGLGKTLIMAAICRIYNCKILILENTIDLIKQTYDKFINYGFSPKEIGVIGGGNFDDTKRITILTIQSYEKAYNLFPYVKVIIADEGHQTGRTNEGEKIIYSCQNATIHISCSATIEAIDNPYEAMRLIGNYGPIIYKKDIKEGIDQDHLSNVEIEIYKYSFNRIMAIGTWGDIYDDDKLIKRGDEYTHIVDNKERNNKIISIIKKYTDENRRILLIFNRIEHGEILKEMYPDAKLIHGQHKIIERDGAKDILKNNKGSVVISSMIFHKGVDIPEVDIIIIAAGGKSSVRLIQTLGRGVRKSKTTNKQKAIIIDFDDTQLSGIGKRQTEKRISIYKKLNLPIKFL